EALQGRYSLQRTAAHSGKFTNKSIRYLAGHRQLVTALGFFNRRPRFRIGYAAGLDLAVTEIAQRALDRKHALGWSDQFGDWVVAPGLDRCRTIVRHLGIGRDNGAQQAVAHVRIDLQTCGLDEVARRCISLGTPNTVNRAIVESLAAKLTLDV